MKMRKKNDILSLKDKKEAILYLLSDSRYTKILSFSNFKQVFSIQTDKEVQARKYFNKRDQN